MQPRARPRPRPGPSPRPPRRGRPPRASAARSAPAAARDLVLRDVRLGQRLEARRRRRARRRRPARAAGRAGSRTPRPSCRACRAGRRSPCRAILLRLDGPPGRAGVVVLARGQLRLLAVRDRPRSRRRGRTRADPSGVQAGWIASVVGRRHLLEARRRRRRSCRSRTWPPRALLWKAMRLAVGRPRRAGRSPAPSFVSCRIAGAVGVHHVDLTDREARACGSRRRSACRPASTPDRRRCRSPWPTRWAGPPVAGTSKSAPSRAKTIRLPSGDHDGCSSSWLRVRQPPRARAVGVHHEDVRRPVAAARRTRSAAPSGDQAGSTWKKSPAGVDGSPFSFVSRYACLPSASAPKIA